MTREHSNNVFAVLLGPFAFCPQLPALFAFVAFFVSLGHALLTPPFYLLFKLPKLSLQLRQKEFFGPAQGKSMAKKQ